MQYSRGLGQNQAPVRPAPEPAIPPAMSPSVKEIPYDYVARFVLTGVRGNRVEDVINISIEGAFVAVAIGYSFIPRQKALFPDNISFEREITDTSNPPDPPTINISLDKLISSLIFKFIQVVGGRVSVPDGQGNFRTGDPQLESTVNNLIPLVQTIGGCLPVRLCGIDFKYSIIDSGSGRELQNQPIHNIAGLGSADGDRPFRPFAKPMVFLPRSTVRIAVDEVSEGDLYRDAELFIVLHGYKMLGYGTGQP